MNVLIAENEFTSADTIQTLTANMGHTAAWACSGPEMLQCLAEKNYQLLIVSAQLRDADVMQLIPALRKRLPDMPVVALTSHNSLALEQQIRQLGVIYYLIKPLNIHELGSIVSHVSRKQA